MVLLSLKLRLSSRQVAAFPPRDCPFRSPFSGVHSAILEGVDSAGGWERPQWTLLTQGLQGARNEGTTYTTNFEACERPLNSHAYKNVEKIIGTVPVIHR